jgi:hypothetical protein
VFSEEGSLFHLQVPRHVPTKCIAFALSLFCLVGGSRI